MIKLPVHVIEMDGGFARLQGADLWISPGVLAVDEAHQIAKALNAHPAAAAVVSGDWRERIDEAIERRIEAFSNGSCFDEQLAIIAEIDSLLDEAVTMPEPTRFVIIPETDENDYQALSLRDSRFPEHPFCRIHASEALQLAAALIKASKETPPADRSGG